jgi:hypothetical protein
VREKEEGGAGERKRFSRLCCEGEVAACKKATEAAAQAYLCESNYHKCLFDIMFHVEPQLNRFLPFLFSSLTYFPPLEIYIFFYVYFSNHHPDNFKCA